MAFQASGRVLTRKAGLVLLHRFHARLLRGRRPLVATGKNPGYFAMFKADIKNLNLIKAFATSLYQVLHACRIVGGEIWSPQEIGHFFFIEVD